MRPRQWVKNFLVFFPLFFSGRALESPELIGLCALTAVFFSLICSAGYCLNDLMDLEADRLDSSKNLRVIASGLVAPPTAFSFALFLAFTGTSGLILSGNNYYLAALALSYFLYQITYSAWLKHIPYLEILVLSGFLLFRVFVGSLVTNIVPSGSLLLTTFFGSLVLALGKRLAEKQKGVEYRPVLSSYSEKTLQRGLRLSSILLVLVFLSWTIAGLMETRLTPGLSAISVGALGLGVSRYLCLARNQNLLVDQAKLFLSDRRLVLYTFASLGCMGVDIYGISS